MNPLKQANHHSDLTGPQSGKAPRNHLWPVLENFSAIQAVCLFGSAAREEEGDGSDRDVLVVVGDTNDVLKLRRQARAIRNAVDENTQVALLTESRLRDNFGDRTVFAAHLAREGRIVADRDGLLTELIAMHPKDEAVSESSKRMRAQLDVYSDLSWCGGHYLFCLADLYAWSRSGAMLALARRGEFEFDRDRVFDHLAVAFPDLSQAAATARSLRPFWEKVNRPTAKAFPFSPVDSHQEVREARGACKAILEKGL